MHQPLYVQGKKAGKVFNLWLWCSEWKPCKNVSFDELNIWNGQASPPRRWVVLSKKGFVYWWPPVKTHQSPLLSKTHAKAKGLTPKAIGIKPGEAHSAAIGLQIDEESTQQIEGRFVRLPWESYNKVRWSSAVLLKISLQFGASFIDRNKLFVASSQWHIIFQAKRK